MIWKEWIQAFKDYIVSNKSNNFINSINKTDKLVIFSDDTSAGKHDRVISLNNIKDVIKDDIINETVINIGYYYYEIHGIYVECENINWVIDTLDILYNRAFYYDKSNEGDIVVELDIIHNSINGIGVRSRGDDLKDIVVILTT